MSTEPEGWQKLYLEMEAIAIERGKQLAVKDERIEQLGKALFHMTESANIAEQQLAAKDALLLQAKEALAAVSPLMIPGVTWTCDIGTMIKRMVLEAVEAIDKELGK